MASAPNSTTRDTGSATKRGGRRAYAGALPVALIGLVATLAGFAPTFFLRLGEVDMIHLVHGWTMTGWIVLFLAQVTLIRTRRFAWHRQLGWASLVLFAAMVVTSLQVLILMLSGKSGLPFEAAKFFGYSDIVGFPLLIFCFCAAIHFRGERNLHSRLIAVTVLISIVPALSRMFNLAIWRTFEGLYLSMHPTYLLVLGALGLSAFADWRADKLRWPLPLAFSWFAGLYATQWPIMQVGWYDGLCRWIGSLG